MAQWLAQLTVNQWVIGSNPITPAQFADVAQWQSRGFVNLRSRSRYSPSALNINIMKTIGIIISFLAFVVYLFGLWPLIDEKSYYGFLSSFVKLFKYKRFKDLKIGDKIYSINPYNNTFECCEIASIEKILLAYRFYIHPIIGFENTESIELSDWEIFNLTCKDIIDDDIYYANEKSALRKLKKCVKHLET